jgi:hypothetical protein
MPVSQLILLVGSNPVPNAVAARCLADRNTQIILVHSFDSSEVAERLRDWLAARLPDNAAQLRRKPLNRPGDEYRPAAIQAALRTNLPAPNPSSVVHLHYTGGTKAMTVHAYRTLETSLRQEDVRFEASYLDPAALALIVDPTSTRQEDEVCPVPDDIRLTMADFLTLHGLKLDDPIGVSTPMLPELAMALVTDHATHGPAHWETWLNRELIPKTCRFKPSDLPGRLPDDPDGTLRDLMMPDTGRYLADGKLNAVQLRWPRGTEYENFNRVFDGLEVEQLPLREAATGMSVRSAKTLCKWLRGQWLESAVLHVLIEKKEQLGLHQCLMNIELKGEFEFDVIAIKGYRLFAFSCTSGEQNKGYLKHKLFEASIRARQMGGDEARVALVCCSDKHQEVQSELEKEFDLKNKIRVFGRPDLANLEGALAHWIESQSPKRNV